MSKAVVISTGLRADGHREVLGVDVGDSENETFWTEFLRDHKNRGLAGVKLVISDAHAGLKAAIRTVSSRAQRGNAAESMRCGTSSQQPANPPAKSSLR